jgi:hypothetical protein
MSTLHPDIGKLMRLARKAPAEDESAPPGFASRVVARSRSHELRAKMISLRLYSAASWASAFVLLICGLVLAQNSRTPKPATDFAVAAHFLAKNLIP